VRQWPDGGMISLVTGGANLPKSAYERMRAASVLRRRLEAVSLLTDLLTDGPVRGVIERHSPTRRIGETLVTEHCPASTETCRHPRKGTHNPKVAGSNPAPATNEKPCVARVFGISGISRIGRCEPPYRVHTASRRVRVVSGTCPRRPIEAWDGHRRLSGVDHRGCVRCPMSAADSAQTCRYRTVSGMCVLAQYLLI
jgi:hypothetical protein